MKKIVLSLGLAAFLFAFDKVLPQKEAIEILKSSVIYPKIKPILDDKNTKLNVVKKDGFYIINIKSTKGSGNLYMTQDKKYLIVGNIINNKTGENLDINLPKNVNIIKKGVVFSFGEGKKDIYIVTDPQCPFCRLMEKKLGDTINKNYRVHIILWPLPFHKNAKAMSYYILAAKSDKERAKRFKETLLGSNKWKEFKPTKEEKTKIEKELQNSINAARELKATGTPSVYDDKFNSITWTKLGEKK